MFFVFLLLIFFVLTSISSYLMHKTQVCLHYGKAIATEDHLKMNPTGFQDALTDPKGNLWFFLVHIILIFNIASFFYFYSIASGISVLIAYFILVKVVARFFTNIEDPKWILDLHGSLSRREADYKRDGDELRYQAARELREILEIKYTDTIQR